MKRLIATVMFAVLAAPVFAQSSLGRTDAIGPDWVFGVNAAAERIQVASSGATRSDAAPAIGSGADEGADEVSRHVERQPGYFDPSQ
jgi:hypothetical protein